MLDSDRSRDKPIAASFPLLKLYAWFSLVCVIAIPVIKVIWKLTHGGINYLVATPGDQHLTHAASVHIAFVSYSLVLIYIALWVRGTILLLKTSDQQRVRKILGWFLVVFIGSVVLNALGKPQLVSVGIYALLALATLGIVYMLNTREHVDLFSDFKRMTGVERRRAIATSVPVTFILFTIPFGIIETLTSQSNHHHFSIANVLVIGVPFGIIMTTLSRRRMNKFNATTGVSGTSQQWAMHDVIRTGKLPKDPEMLQALPAYLAQRLEANRKAAKYTPGLLVFIASMELLIGIFAKDRVLLSAAVFFIGFAVLGYRTIGKQAEKLTELQSKLEHTNKS